MFSKHIQAFKVDEKKKFWIGNKSMILLINFCQFHIFDVDMFIEYTTVIEWQPSIFNIN